MRRGDLTDCGQSTMRIITIALLTTLATLAPAQAQDARFHDAQGRVTVAYCEFRYG